MILLLYRNTLRCERLLLLNLLICFYLFSHVNYNIICQNVLTAVNNEKVFSVCWVGGEQARNQYFMWGGWGEC